MFAKDQGVMTSKPPRGSFGPNACSDRQAGRQASTSPLDVVTFFLGGGGLDGRGGTETRSLRCSPVCWRESVKGVAYYLWFAVVSIRLQLVCRLSSFVLDISVSIDDRPQVTEEYDRIKTQRVSEAVMLKNISKIKDRIKRCVRE